MRGLLSAIASSRKAIRDVSISLIPQAATALSAFVTAVLIARGLGPSGMGKYALIISFATVATGISDLGIGQTAIRFASRAAAIGNRVRQLAVLRWAFRIRLLLVSSIAVAAFFAAPFMASHVWHAPDLAPLVRLTLITVFCSAVASVPLIYFQSEKRFSVSAGVSVGQTLLSLTGIVIISLMSLWRLESVIIVTILAAAAGAVLFIFLVPKGTFIDREETELMLQGRCKFWSVTDASVDGAPNAEPVGGFAGYMVLSSILVTLIMQADVWLIGYFLTKDQVGVYNVAARITQPLAMALGAVNTALWPRAAAAATVEAVGAMMRRTIRLCFAAAVAGMIYAICAPLLIPTVFGTAYGSSVYLSQLLGCRYVIAMLICPLGVIGYSLGLIRVYVITNLLQLLLVVWINCMLLPRFGPVGSAWALLANELFGSIVIGCSIWRRLSAPANRRLS